MCVSGFATHVLGMGSVNQAGVETILIQTLVPSEGLLNKSGWLSMCTRISILLNVRFETCEIVASLAGISNSQWIYHFI